MVLGQAAVWHARDQRLTRRGPDQAEHHAQRGGLACPLGPRNPVTVPAGAVNEMSLTAIFAPKSFVRPRISTSAIVLLIVNGPS
jgi:hypothetical protein